MPLSYAASNTFSDDLREPHRYKIVLITSGSGILTLDSERRAFIAPSILCLSETSAARVENAANVALRIFYFHPTAINRALTFANMRNEHRDAYSPEAMDYSSLRPFRHQNYAGWLHNLGPVEAQRLQEIFNTLERQLDMQPDGFWPCRARTYLIELLFAIVQIYLNETHEQEFEPQCATESVKFELPTPPEQPEIYPVLVHLLNNYHKRITIPELSKAFHTNRNSLSQKFKKATGTTVVEYLSKVRVRVACQLLKDSSLPIIEISERTGYVDVTHFGRTFRKYTSLSPSEYRDRYQGEVSLRPHQEN